MTISRFILAATAGGCAFWILIFLGSTFDPGYDSTGVIFWNGVIGGEFSPGYVAMLYLPPVLLIVCSYFALRRSRNN